MALTKEKIIGSIYHQVGLSKNRSRLVVETLFEIIKQTLEQGEDLLVSGFGKFVVKEKSARRGRNPQTTMVLKTDDKSFLEPHSLQFFLHPSCLLQGGRFRYP
ncbi:MAG: integration host factor subunit alpha [Deltaproteobacteria bacterium]